MTLRAFHEAILKLVSITFFIEDESQIFHFVPYMKFLLLLEIECR